MSEDRCSVERNKGPYQMAYEQVCEETARYYQEHREKATSYLSYVDPAQLKNTDIGKRYAITDKKDFKTDQAAVIEILIELDRAILEDSNLYPIPSSDQDLYFEDLPSHLKVVWNASKIVCKYFGDIENFSGVNNHLQAFAFKYHPKAPAGPDSELTKKGSAASIYHPPSPSASVCVIDEDYDAEYNKKDHKRPGCTIC
jgi:hypothetical protein